MSGLRVDMLKRRALGFLADARIDVSRGDYDLACFHAEQAIQLYLKAILLELFAEDVKIHGVRALLGLLAVLLRKHGFEAIAKRVEDFSENNRYLLIKIEDSYIDTRYGEMQYEESMAREFISIAEKLIELLEGVAKDVKLG